MIGSTVGKVGSDQQYNYNTRTIISDVPRQLFGDFQILSVVSKRFDTGLLDPVGDSSKQDRKPR